MNIVKKIHSGRLDQIQLLAGLFYHLCLGTVALIITSIGFGFVLAGLGMGGTDITARAKGTMVLYIIIVYVYFTLALTSLYVRRLHDFNRSGWQFLYIFIPIFNIGFIIYIHMAGGNETIYDYGKPFNGFNFKQLIGF